MRSVTSCFNFTLYRKTMARFWPMWVLYGVMWLFIIPLNLLNQYFDGLRFDGSAAVAREAVMQEIRYLPSMLEAGVWIACFAGVLAAMAVFGYLYNNRSAGMMHTLPLRRETLFFTQYLSGLSFLLLPHLVVGLLTAGLELCLLLPHDWEEALGHLAVWLLGQSGNSLFFYSFAVFCAMFTGNILALPAFYGILNGLVAGVYALGSTLMENLFYGFPGATGNNRLVMYCTPVWALTEAGDWNVVRHGIDGDFYYSTSEWCLESPEVLIVYAAAGVVFTLLALLVYRRRHVETAGDVVSVAVVRPIFRAGVSFCSGLAFGLFVAAFFSWDGVVEISVCMVLLSVVGWFAAEMLLKKSFRVFRFWRGAAGTAVVMTLLCVACGLDCFGLETRLPRAEDVESIDISANLGMPYDGGDLYLSELTDPEAIAQIVTLHQAVVGQRDRQRQSADTYIYLDLTYNMENGSALERRYYSVPIWKEEVAREGSAAWAASQLLDNRELTAQCYGIDQYDGWLITKAYLSDVKMPDGNVETLHLSESQGALQQLWQAVRRDFDEGTIGVRYLFDDNERRANTYVTDLHFRFEIPEEDWDWQRGNGYSSSTSVEKHFYITMTPNARNTLNWMEKYTHYDGPDSQFFLHHE